MKKRTDNTPARRAWEKHNKKRLEPGMHIHHVDGNSFNNNPDNLLAVTAKQHYDIHLNQGDFASCIRLSKAAKIDSLELASLQHKHGISCVERKIGIHSENFDHSAVSKQIWSKTPPGRKPVTDGVKVYKFKTNEEVELFLSKNPGWRKGLPDSYKKGLKLSSRKLTSIESAKISKERIKNGTHNFIQDYVCPHCNKSGKGPMMKRWHFNNCKNKDGDYGVGKEHDKKYN